ncbi:hypothetical protein Lalb_Chr20g0114411 [Lupinus albus]|uniref:Uncharacterized protein n=1 Tax=Lupinus albus TaxID=3870 RepID=A0A6A4NJV3_LUPAL|nr:hypothetical protein Lalb_Chr20g0114411 [Lupinus albus]
MFISFSCKIPFFLHKTKHFFLIETMCSFGKGQKMNELHKSIEEKKNRVQSFKEEIRKNEVLLLLGRVLFAPLFIISA